MKAVFVRARVKMIMVRGGPNVEKPDIVEFIFCFSRKSQVDTDVAMIFSVRKEFIVGRMVLIDERWRGSLLGRSFGGFWGRINDG